MSLAAVVQLLQTALILLQLVTAHPELPQSMRDNATSVARNAITQATIALNATKTITTTSSPTQTTNFVSPTSGTAQTVPTPPASINVTPIPTATPVSIPNILVGFWGAALANNYAGDYIQDASTHSNVAVFDQSAGNYASRIDEATAAGAKSVLMISSTIFSNGRSLFPEYRARFDTMWDALGARQSNVVGFYLTDEPYWNNQSAGVIALSDSELKANLAAAAEYVHTKAPGRRIMLTEGYPVIASRNDISSLYPESIDYVGLNCYLAFGAPCSESEISSLVAKLVGGLKSGQKLMATMDGYWPTTPNMQNDADLRTRIIFWENVLAPYFASGRVGAITPFIYQSVPNDPNGVHGIVESPNALAELYRYMDSVRAGSPQPSSVSNIANGKNVQVSNTYAGNSASNAVDGNSATVWNSGGYSPQWLQIDLGAIRAIQEFRLTVEQSPAGLTMHNVSVSATGAEGSWQLAKTFQGTTTAQQVLSYVLPKSPSINARYVRVDTTVSPSWVAWREVEVLGY